MGKASLELLCNQKMIPSIIVTNDWYTGLTAGYGKGSHFGEAFKQTTFFHICHNLETAYQGRIYTNNTYNHIHQLDNNWLIDPYWKEKVINPSRCAILLSDQWGTVSKSYMNDLVNSISDFANNYNSMIEKTSNVESSSVLSNVLSITKMTRYNATSLSEIGISLGNDNKLTVNKEQLKNADLDKINSLFGQNGSFGDYTANRVSSLNSLCVSQIKSELNSERYNTISSYLNTSY